ncbi:hypothetical protein Pfl01_3322 [Pseudomonas fluorescens Pf0-1]|uniref:Uncharacterized protein n=1 Tax=Pseudomonas fluorescens (strain Pf0-1) TaxID=205922 RepID=Q3KAZ4_PSEPF|nr:hypothetical protein Pfl01_3322 [Pseudomonas fluorescens Pf0-1]
MTRIYWPLRVVENSIAALESPTPVDGMALSKAIFCVRYVGKVIFLVSFFPKVRNQLSLGGRDAFSFNIWRTSLQVSRVAFQ